MKTSLLPAIALCGIASTSHAEGLAKTRDGLFLAFGLGIGYGSMSTEATIPTSFTTTTDMEMTNSGLTNSFDFRIGGTVAQDLALHATLVGDAIGGPETELKIGGRTKTVDAFNSVGFSMLGVGATKYFTPADAFVSASAGIATFQVEDTSESSSKIKDRGFALQGKVGKEWWISPNWALGVAGVVNWAYVSPSDETDKYLSAGVQFSATYW
ncbi:MAG TPA: hypothetical protein PKO15_12540 [Fibrobacteria bacterium]|nr:hypothetical protein [Fibrobacteria bacterium]